MAFSIYRQIHLINLSSFPRPLYTIKRLRLRQGKALLVAEPPALKPLEITEGMEFEVWGVVTYVIHRVK